jgi:hypothetical protein
MNGAEFGKPRTVDAVHLPTLWAEFVKTLPIVI